MAIKGKEDVVLMRPGEVDRYGDPVGEPATLAIFTNCLVWPRVSTEVEREGTVITEGYNVWVPWGPNKGDFDVIDEVYGALKIDAEDRVIVRGDEWQIQGTPADQRTMKSKRLGLQMVVGRIA